MPEWSWGDPGELESLCAFGQVVAIFGLAQCSHLKNGDTNSIYLLGSFWRCDLKYVKYLAQSLAT